MVARERSLRDVVNMWLGSDVAGRTRVTRIARSRREARRGVAFALSPRVINAP
jgi:hypothetical protein